MNTCIYIIWSQSEITSCCSKWLCLLSFWNIRQFRHVPSHSKVCWSPTHKDYRFKEDTWDFQPLVVANSLRPQQPFCLVLKWAQMVWGNLTNGLYNHNQSNWQKSFRNVLQLWLNLFCFCFFLFFLTSSLVYWVESDSFCWSKFVPLIELTSHSLANQKSK